MTTLATSTAEEVLLILLCAALAAIPASVVATVAVIPFMHGAVGGWRDAMADIAALEESERVDK